MPSGSADSVWGDGGGSDESSASLANLRIGIAITSIPPRFTEIHRSLESWLKQDYPISRICLFIPKTYKRFRRKKKKTKMSTMTQREGIDNNDNDDNDSLLSYSSLLEEKLKKKAISLWQSKKVHIISMDRDWGPITKLMGVLEEQANPICFPSHEMLPDFWIFADDDVGYQPYTVSKYIQWWYKIQDSDYSQSRSPPMVLTNFAEDYRLVYYPTQDREDQEKKDLQIVQHLQGVDTYWIAQCDLQYHYNGQLALSLIHVQEIVEILHKECPEIFYQDDYLVSFLLHRAGFRLQSIWMQDNLAIHLEGLSKSLFQMHMNELVTDREQVTKACIFSLAPSLPLAITGDSGSNLPS